MKFHEELNPKIWTKMTEKRIGGKTNYYLKPEVRDKLNQISDAFIEYLDIPEKAILDIRITGSSANYNYTPHSDLDLHIIVDYDKVHKDCPIVEGYLWSMKSAFNKDHDISIYGIPVELYAEDSRVEAISNGVYSLLNNKWLKIPEKIKPTSNDAAVEAKFNELAEAIDKCDDSEVAKELQDKIYQMRKTGLSQEGEFSTENLAFKKLRDIGALEMLKAMKKEKIDKELSLESYNKSDDDLTNFYIIIDGDYNWLEEYGTFKSSKAAQEWLDKNGEEDWMYSRLTKGEMKDLGIDEFGYVNESVNESNKKYRLVVADDKYTRLRDLYGRRGRKRTLHVKATGETKQFLSGPKKEYKDIKTGELFYLGDNSDIMTDIMGEPYTKFEIISESFNKVLDEEEFKIKVTLSNGKEKYYKAKDLQSAKIKFNDLCIRFNNCQLLQGDKVLYKQNESKNESIKEEFNIGDKVWRRNPETQDRMIGEVIDKSYKDGQEYLRVKFHWWSSHDGTYPADFFQKLDKNESIKEYYEEDDTDSSEEMYKTDYVIRFRTMQGQIKKLFLSIITDGYDPSYNEVINTTSDRQLGLFDTFKQAKDCIKNTAEKCARNTGYTIISIDNLGNDYEYYLKRNNYESLNNWDTSKLSIKELNLKVERLLENFN